MVHRIDMSSPNDQLPNRVINKESRLKGTVINSQPSAVGRTLVIKLDDGSIDWWPEVECLPIDDELAKILFYEE